MQQICRQKNHSRRPRAIQKMAICTNTLLIYVVYSILYTFISFLSIESYSLWSDMKKIIGEQPGQLFPNSLKTFFKLTGGFNPTNRKPGTSVICLQGRRLADGKGFFRPRRCGNPEGYFHSLPRIYVQGLQIP